MFITSKTKSYRDSFSYRAGKTTSNKKKERSFREKDLTRSKTIATPQSVRAPSTQSPSSSNPTSLNLNSAIITISVGPSQRLFAAHEDILCKSPYFADICQAQFFEASGKRVDLPNEEPAVFSAVLEYLYKGDYTPRVAYDKKRGTWYLEDAAATGGETAIYQAGVGGNVLRDTIIYCSAGRYNLPELQRLAIKKQGLQTGVQCSTVLTSARFAYANTPASDCKLRAHYLALIIRSRNTFKRSGTMQLEMEAGGTPLFFDLFVALVNHLDDVAVAGGRSHSPS